MSAPVLCYVSAPWAYFTTRNLSEQCGDDWDDAPYEHNAGPPYEFMETGNKGVVPWVIVRVAYSGAFDTPCDGHCNSPWSVEQINRGEVPWLRMSAWTGAEKPVAIYAGTTLAKFCELIREGGGTIYLPQ